VKHGIRSTYYIRTRGPYNILERRFHNWLKNLSDSGFEVGLHYETLYYSNYNFTEAERLLELDLNLLRSIVPVYTVCSHGNAPRQKHINYEVFIRNPDLYSRLRIEGEAYLTVFKILRELKTSGIIRDYVYLSDTYRRDIDWIGCLRNASAREIIYILIHPDNWRSSLNRLRGGSSEACGLEALQEGRMVFMRGRRIFSELLKGAVAEVMDPKFKRIKGPLNYEISLLARKNSVLDNYLKMLSSRHKSSIGRRVSDIKKEGHESWLGGP